jgi:L-threonylcarbamoyladenylate synthase
MSEPAQPDSPPEAAQALTEHAAAALLAGQLVVIPTETVYGLAADASQAQAVRAIFTLKGRPSDHPLIVHIGALEQAHWWCGELSDAQRQVFNRLATSFWPGPITLVVPLAEYAPRFASAGQSTVGLRMPSHPLALSVLQRFHALGGYGIAAPSANRFGRISPTTAQHVRDDLAEHCPLLLDGGPCEVGLESTIIDLSRTVPVLLRPGGVSLEQIERALGTAIQVSPNIARPTQIDDQAPRVPGSLAAHYAPLTPTRMVSSEQFAALMLARAAEPGQRVGLALQGDPQTYGAALYARLRALDQSGALEILIEHPPGDPAWLAVLDRLQRATQAHRGGVYTTGLADNP